MRNLYKKGHSTRCALRSGAGLQRSVFGRETGLGPLPKSSRDVAHLAVTGGLKQARGDRRATPALTVDRDRLIRRQLGNPVGQLGKRNVDRARNVSGVPFVPAPHVDRKSTRLNSSHGYISYAVFCLKKKKKIKKHIQQLTNNAKRPHYTL